MTGDAVRVVTRLAQFEFRSTLKTWAYRIAVNYILDVKKSPVERMHLSFDRFAEDLADGLSSEGPLDSERSVLTEELKVGCTLGMLQCLDRPHRLAYVLGGILELPGPEAADAMEISPDVFRTRLQHARAAIFSEGNMNSARILLSSEVAAFAAAALVHAGVIADGDQHREAMIAESVIALVLTLGLLAGMATPRWTRAAALAAQGCALLGTCVGIFTIIAGIGPQARFDVAFHAGLVVLLTVGLAVAARSGPSDLDEGVRARLTYTSGGGRSAPSSPSRSGR